MVGLAGIKPPPCVEFQVAAFPERMTEADQREAVPSEVTDVPLRRIDSPSKLDADEVGKGASTPAPAVAFNVTVAKAVVKTPVPPVPIAETDVGNITPAPSLRLKVDVPEKIVVVPLSTT